MLTRQGQQLFLHPLTLFFISPTQTLLKINSIETKTGAISARKGTIHAALCPYHSVDATDMLASRPFPLSTLPASAFFLLHRENIAKTPFFLKNRPFPLLWLIAPFALASPKGESGIITISKSKTARSRLYWKKKEKTDASPPSNKRSATAERAGLSKTLAGT